MTLQAEIGVVVIRLTRPLVPLAIRKDLLTFHMHVAHHMDRHHRGMIRMRRAIVRRLAPTVVISIDLTQETTIDLPRLEEMLAEVDQTTTVRVEKCDPIPDRQPVQMRPRRCLEDTREIREICRHRMV